MASTPFIPPAMWASGTNQNSIPANDNALRFQISQSNVNNATTAQPVSPSEGDTYIIQSTHTGTQWSTFTPKDVAIYSGGTWYAYAPVAGQRISVSGTVYVYNAGAWGAAGAGGSIWGSITGTLSSQTDLQAALDAKAVVGVHQNSQSAAYTLVLGDANKHIFHPSADTTARIWTIPANSSVAFPIGTCVTFVNQNAGGVITIAITTDTMRLAGPGTTGSRTLAANGMATAIKVTSTEWLISGTGLS